MRTLMVLLLLLTGTGLTGREFDRNYFRNTEWFISNQDSSFFRSDTLRLVRYSNAAPAWYESGGYAESELSYLGHGHFSCIHFLRFGNMNYSERVWNSIGVGVPGDFNWNWESREQTLRMNKNGALFCRFKPLSERNIRIKSRFAGPDSLQTVELTCVRVR